MPFHIEISSPIDRARVLNVGETELRREVLEPWVSGLPFEFGGKDWHPRESRLTILEGPALAPGAADDGWAGALRAAEDVTRTMLEAAEASAPVQMVVEVDADSIEAALAKLRSGKAPRQVPWSRAVERIGGHDPEVAAVILVVRRPRIDWPEL